MLNNRLLQEILTQYKKDFSDFLWRDEIFKWEAVQHFQDHWDINSPNFREMFEKATEKTYNLLASMNFFPRGMILGFAQADPESTRAMFLSLFDESKDLADRVSKFEADADALREQYDDGTWKNHYQTTNSISTYLWLRFPKKYYIYKYSEYRAVSLAVESDFLPKKGQSTQNLIKGYAMYDEIRKHLQQDDELLAIFKEALSDTCYPDPEFITLTIDVGFYISQHYQKRKDTKEDGWFPADYQPGITTKRWTELLGDRSVFHEDSLKIMKRLQDIGGAATCTELAKKYGGPANFYNTGSSALAQRVAKATGCHTMSGEEGNTKWWPILYTGKSAEKEQEGSFTWKMRDELREALQQVDLSDIPLYDNTREENPVESQQITESYSKEDFLKAVFMSEAQFDTLALLLKKKKNLILQGAPGVGKTYAARRLAHALMGAKDNSRIEFVQFHQNYSYEDFVMGYRPGEEGFQLKNGIFYRFCQKAMNRPDEPFYFIIDEINRGNLSKIFGELLMLIEADYRDMNATLAYNGLPFFVPRNLHIIGLMNTADRSLALIDYALRRRFSFYEMEPGFNTDGFRNYQNQLNDASFNAVVEEIKALNRAIADDSSLGRGFCIGHSYFCNQEECTEQWLNAVVEFDILPMLSEYWFDEPDKLSLWENRLRGVFHD